MKQADVYWLQELNQINGNNLKNIKLLEVSGRRRENI
jgi:hypothetical protein